MTVKILESVFAEVVGGCSIQAVPRWMLSSLSVVVAPYNSMKENDREVTETCGSFDYFGMGGEGFRFSNKDLLLQSIWFRVPEVHIPSDKIPILWQNEQSQIGLLRLSSAEEFRLDLADVRWLDMNAGILVCMTEASLTAVGERLRLRITDNFDLLFIDRKLCGWLLCSPENYLVELFETLYLPEPDNELKALLYESLTLVSEPTNIEKIHDEDPDILQALVDLQGRIKYDYGAVNQRKILHSWIKGIIEWFYYQTV